MCILQKFIQSELKCYICGQNPSDKEMIYDIKLKQCYHIECLKAESTKKIKNAITTFKDI